MAWTAIAMGAVIIGASGFLFWYATRRDWNVLGEDDARRAATGEEEE